MKRVLKRIITIILVLGILAAGVYAFIQYRQQAQAESVSNLQTVAASEGELIATIGATGVVRSNQTAVLAWQTSGTVEQIKVEVGDDVEVDQVLATLERTSLPQNIILARVDLINAQQALDDLYTNAELAKVNAMQSIATYAQAFKQAQYQLDNYIPPAEQAELDTMDALDLMQERLDKARVAFEPYKYYSSGNDTRQDLKEDLDQAQSDYNAAVKRLEYEYELEVARANMAQARDDYEKWKNGPVSNEIAAIEARVDASQAALDLAQITAPFNGKITAVYNKPGDQVSPGMIAFQIDDLAHLLVDVNVSEVDINRIRLGQDVTLSYDAIPDREYQGVVTEVDQVGTSTQGVVDFKVTVELIDADEDVKPGMTAAVTIVVNQLEGVLLVPNRAVRVQDGKRVVYVLQGTEPVPVEIVLGASSDTMSEVESGELQVGDEIVLNPPLEFDSNGPPPFAR